MKKVFVTGANGFLGKNLIEELLANGFKVIAGSRRVQESTPRQNLIHISYDFNMELESIPQIESCDFIIHTAWQMTGSREEMEKLNINGIKNILKFLNKKKEVRFIFISSLAAHDNAHSTYGISKLKAELLLKDNNMCTVVRPGTIVGEGGLFKRTEVLLKAIPLVPIFYGGYQKLQLIDVHELTRSIVQIIKKDLKGQFALASYPGIEMRKFYEQMSRNLNLKRFYIYLPGDFFLFFIRILENLGLKLPITSDNILGMKYHCEVNTIPDWEKVWGSGTNELKIKEIHSYFERKSEN